MYIFVFQLNNIKETWLDVKSILLKLNKREGLSLSKRTPWIKMSNENAKYVAPPKITILPFLSNVIIEKE